MFLSPMEKKNSIRWIKRNFDRSSDSCRLSWESISLRGIINEVISVLSNFVVNVWIVEFNNDVSFFVSGKRYHLAIDGFILWKRCDSLPKASTLLVNSRS